MIPAMAARAALLIAAVGSLALMFSAGRPPASLMVLFVVWVLSPFAALVLLDSRSGRWPASLRATLYSLMLAVAVGSLAIYGWRAAAPAATRTAFVFLMVPLACWLLGAVVMWTAARRVRRRPARRSLGEDGR